MCESGSFFGLKMPAVVDACDKGCELRRGI